MLVFNTVSRRSHDWRCLRGPLEDRFEFAREIGCSRLMVLSMRSRRGAWSQCHVKGTVESLRLGVVAIVAHDLLSYFCRDSWNWALDYALRHNLSWILGILDMLISHFRYNTLLRLWVPPSVISLRFAAAFLDSLNWELCWFNKIREASGDTALL